MRRYAATLLVGGASLLPFSSVAMAQEAVEKARQYIDFSAVGEAEKAADEHSPEVSGDDARIQEPVADENVAPDTAVLDEDVAHRAEQDVAAEPVLKAAPAEEPALPDTSALQQGDADAKIAEPAPEPITAEAAADGKRLVAPAKGDPVPVGDMKGEQVAADVVTEGAADAPVQAAAPKLPVEQAVPEPKSFARLPVAVRSSEEDSRDDGGFIRDLQKGDRVMILPLSQDQPADTYEPLSVDEAVALAMKNNYEAKAISQSTEATYWEKLATYLLYAPTFEVRYAAGDETSRPASYNDSTGTRAAHDKHVRRDQLYSIRQPIIDMAIVEDILLREVRESYAETVERETREGIAYDTANAYLGLIQAGMLMKMADDYHEYLTRLEERMRARVDGGGATPGDLERVVGRMANAESARLEAEGEYVNALSEFRRITHVTPSRLLVTDKLAPAIPPALSDALAYAQKANSTYVGALQKIDIARGARDKTYSELLPTLNLEASREKAYNAGGAAKGNPVDGVYPDQDDSRLMVVAHWAVSPAYTSLNGVAGNVRVREAEYRARDTKMRVEQALRTGYNTVHATNQRLDVAEKGLQANVNVVSEFEDQQEHGRRSLFELLDAYEQLYGSQVNMVRLITARAQASYLVHRQMGSLLSALQAASMKAHGKDIKG